MRQAAAALLSLSLVAAPVAAKPTKSHRKTSATHDVSPPSPPPPAIPPSSWRALKDTWVEVSIRDGRTVRGRLDAADESTATIVEQSGQVIALNLTEALNLRQVAGPPGPTPRSPDPQDLDITEEFQTRRPKGIGLLVSGGVVSTIGLIGVGLFGAGFGVGAAAQREVESLNPADIDYQDQVERIDQRGRLGESLVYAGAVIGVIGLHVGISLLAVGAHRFKRSRARPGAGTVNVAPLVGRQFGGLEFVLRF